uniref:Bm5407 n=1 Tax=Brugia malayi TaxID=6279 RepID=A0A0H5S388_BRUMA|nr:Bm5407 [Brugia malayi]
MLWLFILLAFLFFQQLNAQELKQCPHIPISGCCSMRWTSDCVPKHCFKHILIKCPDRKILMFKRSVKQKSDLKRSPNAAFRGQSLPLCGTAELGYKPCTSRGVADKLFQSCCNIYVPKECRSLCVYETNQNVTRELLVSILRERKCGLEYLSSILYCASQNRDNRKCCIHLNLNDPQLQVGSRCLRMCDPTGTAIEQITMEDATCMYNWNVIMYCHHSGIREM